MSGNQFSVIGYHWHSRYHVQDLVICTFQPCNFWLVGSYHQTHSIQHIVVGPASKKECKGPGICHNSYWAVIYDSIPLFKTVENRKRFFGDCSIVSLHLTESVQSEPNR